VQLVGVQDPDPAMVSQRAAQVGGPPAFIDYREMLAKTRPDFVVALGRHSEMAGIAHYLLDEGYPFLIEKPVGLNAREVRDVADKAAAKRAFVAVPFFQRYQPFVSHARRMLAIDAFGPVSHFYFRSNRPSSARYVAWGSPWMLDPALAGGGCLRNIGLHGIDAFLHLIGGDAEVTGAQVSFMAHGARVEDYATLVLRTAGGVLGTIEVGNTFPGKGADAEWKLAGRDALLVQRDGALRCTTAAGEQELAGPPSEPMPAIAIRDALRRWQAGQAPATGVEDCYRAMRLVDQAYAIAKG
jgi:predicted dehydrogenase